MNSEATRTLTDTRHTWDERLMRLQGQRGEDVQRGVEAGWTARIGPAVCAVGTTTGLLLMSPQIMTALAVLAAIGAFSAYHPVEAVYVAYARSRGLRVPPPNRAARRFACAMGAVLLGGTAVAWTLGATGIGIALALVMAATATFVTASNICVPSFVFTTLFGARRATEPGLVQAFRKPSITATSSVVSDPKLDSELFAPVRTGSVS